MPENQEPAVTREGELMVKRVLTVAELLTRSHANRKLLKKQRRKQRQNQVASDLKYRNDETHDDT